MNLRKPPPSSANFGGTLPALSSARTASGAWSAGGRVALIYFLVAGTYIVLSDRIVTWVAGEDAAQMEFLQTSKGAAFVVVTALMLLALVARFTRRLEEVQAREAALSERLQAVARIESLGMITGNLAHDFRNNMTAILALAESLRLEQLSEDVRDAIRDIALTAKRSADQVNILLGITRRGEKPPFEEMNILHHLEAWRSLLRCVAGSQIDLRILPPPEEVRILGNPALLFHALLNLVINARDALRGRGEITLEARLVEHGGRNGLELSVTDNGPGVPPQFHDKMFQIGFTTKDPGVGTGYGLPSVAHAASLHGGFVRLDTAYRSGARFVIWLPACLVMADVA